MEEWESQLSREIGLPGNVEDLELIIINSWYNQSALLCDFL